MVPWFYSLWFPLFHTGAMNINRSPHSVEFLRSLLQSWAEDHSGSLCGGNRREKKESHMQPPHNWGAWEHLLVPAVSQPKSKFPGLRLLRYWTYGQAKWDLDCSCGPKEQRPLHQQSDSGGFCHVLLYLERHCGAFWCPCCAISVFPLPCIKVVQMMEGRELWIDIFDFFLNGVH